MGLQELGKIIIYIGISLIVVGIVVQLFPKIPLLGKLPGDIYLKRENSSFYFPLATSIIISLVLTLVLNFLSRIK